MELYYSSLSDVGNVRVKNEDFLFAGKLGGDEYLFVVADGMGGHHAGEVASYKAVMELVRGVKKGTGENILGSLEGIVLDINKMLFEETGKSAHDKRMGTTLSALYIRGAQGYIVHVGDSRIYRYSEKGLVQLTEDHSVAAKLLKDGFITREEVKTHPKRNVLYQSVGLRPGIEVKTLGPVPVREGQKFLLCTDGLNNELADEEIEGFLRFNSTRYIAGELIEKARAGKAADNITVIVVSTERDNTMVLDDTLKMSTFGWKRLKEKRVVYFLLSALLVLLLIIALYLLIKDLQKEPAADRGLRKETSKYQPGAAKAKGDKNNLKNNKSKEE